MCKMDKLMNALSPLIPHKHLEMCIYKLKSSPLCPDLVLLLNLGKGTISSSGIQTTNLEIILGLFFSHPSSPKRLSILPLNTFSSHPVSPPVLSSSSFLPCITSIESWPVHFLTTHHPNWQVDLSIMHVSACHSLDKNCSLAPHCLYNKVKSPW